jgi:hypothetical protein
VATTRLHYADLKKPTLPSMSFLPVRLYGSIAPCCCLEGATPLRGLTKKQLYTLKWSGTKGDGENFKKSIILMKGLRGELEKFKKMAAQSGSQNS